MSSKRRMEPAEPTKYDQHHVETRPYRCAVIFRGLWCRRSWQGRQRRRRELHDLWRSVGHVCRRLEVCCRHRFSRRQLCEGLHRAGGLPRRGCVHSGRRRDLRPRMQRRQRLPRWLQLRGEEHARSGRLGEGLYSSIAFEAVTAVNAMKYVADCDVMIARRRRRTGADKASRRTRASSVMTSRLRDFVIRSQRCSLLEL